MRGLAALLDDPVIHFECATPIVQKLVVDFRSPKSRGMGRRRIPRRHTLVPRRGQQHLIGKIVFVYFAQVESAVADLVVFDPETISDRATYLEPRRYAEGIESLIVNGKMVIEDGVKTKAFPGMIVNLN